MSQIFNSQMLVPNIKLCGKHVEIVDDENIYVIDLFNNIYKRDIILI